MQPASQVEEISDVGHGVRGNDDASWWEKKRLHLVACKTCGLNLKETPFSWYPTDKAQPTTRKRFPGFRWHGIYLGQASLSREAEIPF